MKLLIMMGGRGAESIYEMEVWGDVPMSLFGLGKKIIVVLVVIVSGHVMAAELTHENYQFYQADYNGDGLIDIVLVPKKKILIVAAGTAFPLDYSAMPLVWLAQANGEYASIYPADSQVIAALVLQEMEYQLYIGDFDANGYMDSLFQSPLNGYQTFISYGSGGNEVPLSVSYLGTQGVSLAAATVEIRDIQGDGISDIAFTRNDDSVVYAYGGASQITNAGFVFEPAEPGTVMKPMLTGSFQVDEMGAATYSLPIELPPVSSGMSPQLGLNYSSNFGNGNLGMSWNLNAGSSVSRCPATIADDGYVDGVDFDSNDQFCLDGVRLILVSGEHGANGSEYRMQNDDVQRVFAHGQSGTGPLSWEVWSPKGAISLYGSASDARLQHSDGSILLWHLKSNENVYGNYIIYTYNSDKSSGRDYLESISYGDNLDYRVELEYSFDRADSTETYISGMKQQYDMLLQEIRAYIPGNAAHIDSYNFNYQQGPYGESELIRVGRCRLTGDNCTYLEGFNWNHDLFDFAESKSGAHNYIGPNTGWASVDVGRMLQGDFNGDGIDDLYQANLDGNTADTLHFGLPEGGFNSVTVTGADTYVTTGASDWANVDLGRLKLGDYNGDGRTDIYRINGEQNNIETDSVYISNGDGSFLKADADFGGDADPSVCGLSCLAWSQVDVNRYKQGDFNGDGRTDFYFVDGGAGGNPVDYVFFSNATNESIGASTKVEFTVTVATGINVYVDGNTSWGALDVNRVKIADFNGDGLSDIYYVDGGDSDLDAVYFSNGDGSFDKKVVPGGDFNHYVVGTSSLAWSNVDISRTSIGDFNGDGLSDFYYVLGGGGSNQADVVALSRGDGTFDKRAVSGIDVFVTYDSDWGGVDVSRIQVADFNGDGMSDVYYMRGSTLSNTTDIVAYSNGDGTFNSIQLENFNAAVNQYLSWANIDSSRLKIGDFNGDGSIDIYYNGGAESYSTGTVYYGGSSAPKIDYFPNNVVGQFKVVYSTLAQKTSYAMGGPEDDVDSNGVQDDYPLQDSAGAVRIVSAVETDNGSGGVQRNEYLYYGFKNSVAGHGSLGFRKQEAIDTTTGIRTLTEYSQDYINHTSGMVTRTQTKQIKNGYEKTLNETINTNDVTEVPYGGYVVRMPYLSHQEITSWDYTTEEKIGTAINDFNYEDGNLKSSSTVTTDALTGDTFTTIKNMVYDPIRYSPHYIAGQVSEVESISTVPGTPESGPITSIRKTKFTYYETGAPHTQTIEPGHAQEITTEYLYNANGQVTFTTTKANGMADRVAEVRYNSDGREYKKINALGHETTYLYENSDYPWLITKVIDPNGLASETIYDEWGRAVTSISPDGNSVTQQMKWCDAHCDQDNGEVYYRESTASIGMPSWVFFDKQGREVRKAGYGFAEGSPRLVIQLTEYNSIGKIERHSDPFYEDEAPQWHQSWYDDLGRMLVSYDTAGNSMTTLYVGRTVISSRSNAEGNAQSKIIENNAVGQLVKATDNIGGTIEYAYDAQGNLIYTQDSQGNVIRAGYDVFGRKEFTSDPNKGNWAYEYDAYGQLIRQTDARNIITYLGYDMLGRLVTRYDDYQGQNQELTTWHYDTADLGSTGRQALGMLQRVDMPSYSEAYQYDDLGRATNSTTNIDGASYVASTTYDVATGLPDTTTYPGGGLTLKNHYHPELGNLVKITKNGTQDAYWELQETNAKGQATLFQLGNLMQTTRSFNDQTGYIDSITTYVPVRTDTIQSMSFNFDGVGNLMMRADHKQGVLQELSYDGLNRLLESNTYISSNPTQDPRDADTNGPDVLSLQYDALGNILSKSDVGTYTYGSTASYQSMCGNTYAGPQAVTYIANGANSKSYCYDANGNMTSGDGRTITYGSTDKPITLQKGNSRVDFYYGPSRARYKRIDEKDSIVTTTHYVGPYEKVVTGSTTTHKYYIGNYAVVTQENSNPLETHYLLHDHQGSIVAKVDALGNVVDRFAYDPWGRRIFSNWQTMSTSELNAFKDPIINRGYTGHEHIDSMGLIHMNGRVYDPVIGRFLSADPFVQDATNTQALNRYAYVQNNPLSYTDPSGFFLKKIKKAFKKVVKAVVKVLLAPAYAYVKLHQVALQETARFLAKNPKVGMVVAAAVCFVSGGAGCALASFIITSLTTYGLTGDLTMSLKAGATAAAVAYISSGLDTNVVANEFSLVAVKFAIEASMHHVKTSLVNGAVNAIKGQSFEDGFNASFKIKNTQDYIENMILMYIVKEVVTGGGGLGSSGCSLKNPIDIGTGRKFLIISDLKTGRLTFTRHYNSYSDKPSVMGGKWRHDFEKNLEIDSHSGIIIAARGDGQTIQFNLNSENGKAKPVGNHKETLKRQGDQWLLTGADDSIETYNLKGQLQTITYRDGYVQTLTYENHQLVQIADSENHHIDLRYGYSGELVGITNTGGHSVIYRYNAAMALVRVMQPDDTTAATDNPTVQYLYEDARFPHALTGLIDEAGKRFGTWEYDAQMRAFYEHTEGQLANHLEYQQGNITTLTDALGRSTTYHFNDDGKPMLVEGHPTASCIGSNNRYEYDDQGNLTAKTDWNENRTEFVYNERGLETQRIEAAGTPEAYAVQTKWHPTLRLPVRIHHPGATTEFEYDTLGQLVQKTISDDASWWGGKRTWRYEYNAERKLVSVDGPRDDVEDISRFEYDSEGNQVAVVNTLGHRTTVLAHNADGLPTLLQDQNGAQTRLDYNARGWLIAKAAQQGNGEWATTRYQYTDVGAYDGTGLVQTVTQPNGVSVTYEYNAARQVTAVQNNLGERIEYDLDPMGNRIREQIISYTGELMRTQASVYDELSRLLQSIGADGQSTHYGYDRNGNVTQVTDAQERTTHNAYDALNRLVSSIDALQGETTTAYSPSGGVAQVTDARGIITQYEYNGFGDVVALISQDTGTTAFEYDRAGNQIRKVDANGIVTEYEYDALNRLTHVIYPQSPEENIQYHYDVATVNAVGRLASIEDQTGATQRAYDAQGRVTQETRQINGQVYQLEYGYDVAGNLTRMTYPNGAVIRYHRDELGRVDKITRDTWLGETLLATNIDYLPFGPVSTLRYGNGLIDKRGYDLDYRLRQHRVSGLYDKTYDYTPVGNISSIVDGLNAANDKAYEYDELSRLTQVVDGIQQAEHFQYDAVGNRTLYQRTANGDVVEASTYEYAQTSNRLQAVQTGAVTRTLGYDAAGNTVRDDRTEQQRVLEYGANNRLKLVAKDGLPVARYQHNAQGQRVIRMVEGEEVHYIYDTQDRLVAEAKGDGTVQRQYVYLGRLLIAVEEAANDQWYFVHNDHLGTPKLVSDAQAAVVWRGEAAAFGETTTVGDLGFGFRFPGQTEDGVTGYFYNYFRDYDASLGRYVQSDPIGLKGGLNTFVYVLGNPIGAIDPFGMDSYLVSRPLNDPRFGKVASHNFIVTGATSLGDPSATVFSYGNNGYGAMGRVYAQGTPGMSATTFNTDRNAWLSLASPGSGVAYRQINAPDGDVMALALSVDEGHPYTVVPELLGGVNSNSAAGAVAHAADGGHALVAGGTIEPGASVAYRVGLNGQCVAP